MAVIQNFFFSSKKVSEISVGGGGVGGGAGSTNNYVDRITFDDTTGIITLDRQGLASLATQTLDSRYRIDAQTLSWDGALGQITILDGNTIDIDGRYALDFTGGYLRRESSAVLGSVGVGNEAIFRDTSTGNLFVQTLQAFAFDSTAFNGVAYANVNNNFSVDQTFGTNVVVTGNLTVNGTSFIVNTQTVEAKDNLILINSGEVGAGVTAGLAGIEVDRGTATNYQFLFDESDDRFKIGTLGNLQAVATRADSLTNGHLAQWNSSANRFDGVAAGALSVANSDQLGGVDAVNYATTAFVNAKNVSDFGGFSNILLRTGNSALGVSGVNDFITIDGSGNLGYRTLAAFAFDPTALDGVAYLSSTSKQTFVGEIDFSQSVNMGFNNSLIFGNATYPFSIRRTSTGQLYTDFTDGYNNDNARIRFVMKNGASTPLIIKPSGIDVTGNLTATGTGSFAGDVFLTSSSARLRLGADGGYGLIQRGQATNGTSTVLYFGETLDTGATIFRGSGNTSFESNVGIGTSPSAKLDVNGDIRSRGIFRDYQGEALIHTNTSAVTQIGSLGASTPRSLSFLAGNAERMTIDTSGNVTATGSLNATSLKSNSLLGQTSSSTILIGDVANTVSIRGELDLTGNLTLNGIQFLTTDANYNIIKDGGGNPAIKLGDAIVASNSYNNTVHFFKNRLESQTYATLGAISLDLSVAIKTAAPSSGTAKRWKLGNRITLDTVALDTEEYVEIEIEGHGLVKLAVVNSTGPI